MDYTILAIFAGLLMLGFGIGFGVGFPMGQRHIIAARQQRTEAEAHARLRRLAISSTPHKGGVDAASGGRGGSLLVGDRRDILNAEVIE